MRPLTLVCGLLSFLMVAGGLMTAGPSTAEAGEPNFAPGDEQVRVRTTRSSRSSRSRRYTRSPRRYRSGSHSTHYGSHHYSHGPHHYGGVYVGYHYAPAVVVGTTVVASSTPVIYEGEAVAAWDRPREPTTSVALRFASMFPGDTTLSHETVPGLDLYGFGGAVRFDMSSIFGVEFAMDFMGGETEGIKQFSLPLTGSLLFYPFAGSLFIDPYVSGGVGVIFSELDDPNFNTIERYTQFAGQIGVGAEMDLGDTFMLTGDLRYLVTQVRPDRDREIAVVGQEVPDHGVTVRDQDSIPAVSAYVETNNQRDTVSGAWQFTLGGGWRF